MLGEILKWYLIFHVCCVCFVIYQIVSVYGSFDKFIDYMMNHPDIKGKIGDNVVKFRKILKVVAFICITVSGPFLIQVNLKK